MYLLGDLMNMNEKQSVAIKCESNHIFLLSGAGTGKTRVITSKIEHILNVSYSKPSFLILSFTKRSIFELKSRLCKSTDNIFVTTFHGLANSIVNHSKDKRILDDKYRSLSPMSDDELLLIANEKRLLKNNHKTTMRFNDYSLFLSKNGLIDYLDMEIGALSKLENMSKNDPLYPKFDYIFIDEFQDTSDIQFSMIKLLSGKNTKIFAVGDPDQSIYSFRGTGEKVIESYIKNYSAQKLVLDLNYRCSKKILFHANSLIQHNKRKFRKDLIGVKENFGIVKSILTHNKDNEESLVISNIRDCIKRGHQQKDIVVLFRNHKDAQLLRYGLFDSYLSDIQLLSMHQSKGLEFKVVIIIGLKKYNYPNKKVLEEERRLFFVSLTRAMDELYIYMPVDKNNISRFIKEAKIKYETHD